MSVQSSYQPINCEFHDVLEATAVRGTRATLRVIDPEGSELTVRAAIADVFAECGAEYLRLASGELIRLDRLVSVDGIAASAFTNP